MRYSLKLKKKMSDLYFPLCSPKVDSVEISLLNYKSSFGVLASVRPFSLAPFTLTLLKGQ